MGADLATTMLDHALLYRACLRDADLTRAHLDGVDLTGAQLGPGALAVPEGWTVDHTGKLERAPGSTPRGTER
jgi:hypothetical protein